jgi:hypothetical protein
MSRDQGDGFRSRRIQLEAELRHALLDLTDISVRQLRDLMKDLERDMVSSLQQLSRTAVDGLRDIKQELSVSAAITRRPGPWVAGAAIFGAASAIFFVAGREGRVVTHDATHSKPSDRWLFLLAEWGLTLMKASQHRGARVVKERHD